MTKGLAGEKNETLRDGADSQPAVVGITMGCPVGIGPEIILRLLTEPDAPALYQPVVLGDIGVLEQCRQALGLAIDIRPHHIGAGYESDGCVFVLPLSNLNPADLQWGKPNKETGRAMAGYIKEAVNLAQNGALSAIVTCPISKAALQAAGYPFPGHTEMLASLCRTEMYAMMLTGKSLRVALVTIHVALAQVAELIRAENVFRLIRLTLQTLRQDFGIDEPRLAVAGLNPHAGEGGLFGMEEEKEIRPAVKRAAAAGWFVSGPFPPDTVFYRAAAGEFDGVICMYHDQGLIPFKLLHFTDGVNVTMGLPIVRTSVDHGTAYDIAGKGIANPASLREACRLAASMADNRREFSRRGRERERSGQERE
jgi:4-hydroxythreonine-4-phosphate dehydrogenase